MTGLNKISKKKMPSIYFEQPRFKLYLGDCLEVLKNVRENSVDMIFADPPYFLSSGSFTCQNGRMVSVKKGDWDLSNGHDKNFGFHKEWIRACRRVLKPEGTIWISGTYHSIYQCGYALQQLGFHMLNDIAWFKPNASPNLSCRFFTASHETLIWARKEKKAKHTFNYEEMVNWSDNYKKQFTMKYRGKTKKIELETFHQKGKQMRSVWAINTPKREEKIHGKHPTQKPEALLERVILSSTKKKNIILDPFTGSSTTGIVAYKYGRDFIGIDTEKEYLEKSVKRFQDLKNN